MPSTAHLTIFDRQARDEARKLSTRDLRKTANDVASAARSAAPVLTGRYQGGISVVPRGDTFSVIDTDDTAIHKEYGTSDTPAHAALTEAAIRAGRYRGMMPRGLSVRAVRGR
ncbi:MAG: hypothetical protein LKG15_07830 [Corynebacterium provencense]|uniref:HK97 gp10 family phage protein n=1 Tax=Corynebacterium provencense TaxID=1737425 RepID=UPI002989D02C|nr:hypothetical protein [Corynebacterium provencense]